MTAESFIAASPGFFVVGFGDTGAVELVPVVGWRIADHSGGERGEPFPWPLPLRPVDFLGFGMTVMAPDGCVRELDFKCRTWPDLSAFSRAARSVRQRLRRRR